MSDSAVGHSGPQEVASVDASAAYSAPASGAPAGPPGTRPVIPPRGPIGIKRTVSASSNTPAPSTPPKPAIYKTGASVPPPSGAPPSPQSATQPPPSANGPPSGPLPTAPVGSPKQRMSATLSRPLPVPGAAPSSPTHPPTNGPTYAASEPSTSPPISSAPPKQAPPQIARPLPPAGPRLNGPPPSLPPAGPPPSATTSTSPSDTATSSSPPTVPASRPVPPKRPLPVVASQPPPPANGQSAPTATPSQPELSPTSADGPQKPPHLIQSLPPKRPLPHSGKGPTAKRPPSGQFSAPPAHPPPQPQPAPPAEEKRISPVPEPVPVIEPSPPAPASQPPEDVFSLPPESSPPIQAAQVDFSFEEPETLPPASQPPPVQLAPEPVANDPPEDSGMMTFDELPPQPASQQAFDGEASFTFDAAPVSESEDVIRPYYPDHFLHVSPESQEPVASAPVEPHNDEILENERNFSSTSLNLDNPFSNSVQSTPRDGYQGLDMPDTPHSARQEPAQTSDFNPPADDIPFGEETLPPPPPPDEDDMMFGEQGTPMDDSSMSQEGQYTSILDSSDMSPVYMPAPSIYDVLGREDQTGPPPAGLQPLPSLFHPTRAPPSLPPGIVHPDAARVAAQPAATDAATEEKKKKKMGLGSLFGNKDAKKKEEEDKKKTSNPSASGEVAGSDEKSSSGLMSGLKKMGKKIGGVTSGIATQITTKGKTDGTNSSSTPSTPTATSTPSGFEVSPLKDRLDLYSRMMELLCRPDLHLLNVTASVVKRADVDKQSRAWVQLLTPRGRMVDLLAKVIATEVDKTDHEGTLFRNNTFSVGLMSAFAHEVGRPYLKGLLLPLLQQILNSGLSYEINPEKADGGASDEATIDTNTLNLLNACGAYVSSISQSLPQVPHEIRRVCTLLRQNVQVKFPNSVNTCVGGFFFLRFLTPAIFSPEGYGVLPPEEPIPMEARRPFILISKTLQQISNEMYFSEDHMMPLNSFITENIPAFQQFFIDICGQTPEEPAPPPFTPFSYENNKTRDGALIQLHQFLHKALPEIKAVAQVEPAPPGLTYDPVMELERILTDLGEPPDAKILKAPAPATTPAPASSALPKKK